MFYDFLWGALPYIAFSFLTFGTLLRYLCFERTWTTKSSEFLEKKSLRIAGPLFHLGLFIVILGHISGILIPKYVTIDLGISQHMYHLGAIYGGAIGGTLLVIGFLLLMYRRFTSPRMRANTSRMDVVLYIALGAAIATGYCCAISQNFHDFPYRDSISPWFRGLLILEPDPHLMRHVPTLFKAHMLCWMTVAIIFPFTRLVHCLSFPFSYLSRKPIVYRKR